MKVETMIREGFTARQLYVLQQLYKYPQNATQLATELLSKVSITAITDSLEERGLVERKRSKDDRRVIMIHITEAGREMLTK